MNGKNTICHVIPLPVKIANNRIITQLIKKLTAPDVTADIGNISLGKYTFFIRFPFPVILVVPIKIELVNHVHGIMPHIINNK